MDEHWIARSVGRHTRYSADPSWGHLAEDDRGDLWVGSWRNAASAYDGPPWWGRRFNPRNPLHWLPWMRSRLTRHVAMIEGVP